MAKKIKSKQGGDAVVEYRFIVDAQLDSDIRDALRVEAKKRGVSRVTLKDFASKALVRAARETLASIEPERAVR